MPGQIDPEVERIVSGAAKIIMEGLQVDILVITVVDGSQVGSVACVDVADPDREVIAHAALQEYYVRMGRQITEAVG